MTAFRWPDRKKPSAAPSGPARYRIGDTVSLTAEAMRPLLRGAASSVEELCRLRVVLVKRDAEGAPLYKLVNVDHVAVGWFGEIELVT